MPNVRCWTNVRDVRSHPVELKRCPSDLDRISPEVHRHFSTWALLRSYQKLEEERRSFLEYRRKAVWTRDTGRKEQLDIRSGDRDRSRSKRRGSSKRQHRPEREHGMWRAGGQEEEEGGGLVH